MMKLLMLFAILRTRLKTAVVEGTPYCIILQFRVREPETSFFKYAPKRNTRLIEIGHISFWSVLMMLITGRKQT